MFDYDFNTLSDDVKSCQPLVVYLLLIIISLAVSFLGTSQYNEMMGDNHKIRNVLNHLLVVFLMSALLLWLCKNNYHTIAWVIVLAPLLFGLFMLLAAPALVGTATMMCKSMEKKEK